MSVRVSEDSCEVMAGVTSVSGWFIALACQHPVVLSCIARFGLPRGDHALDDLVASEVPCGPCKVALRWGAQSGGLCRVHCDGGAL